MSAQILDGKGLSKRMEIDLAHRVKHFTDRTGHVPGLAVVLVGDNPASKAYVGGKEKALARVGMKSLHHDVSPEVSAETLKALIHDLGQDPGVDGILVQLPLPKGLDEQDILGAIPPDKDADGFHTVNLGKLIQGRGTVLPCTPMGILKLLDDNNIELRGKHAVVLGRSLIVGKPVSLLLLARDCTVTMAHSKTENLADITRQADILVVACGIPCLVTASMLDPSRQTVVVDVGINRVDGKLQGDVSFDEVAEVAGWITPVPGGVGPLTIGCLLENTFSLALERRP